MLELFMGLVHKILVLPWLTNFFLGLTQSEYELFSNITLIVFMVAFMIYCYYMLERIGSYVSLILLATIILKLYGAGSVHKEFSTKVVTYSLDPRDFELLPNTPKVSQAVAQFSNNVSVQVSNTKVVKLNCGELKISDCIEKVQANESKIGLNRNPLINVTSL